MVVEELRRLFGKLRHVDLEAIRWETHAWPDVGAPQEVINRQIGEYDVFVGLMWKRFGTPTKRAESGTAEEFDRAYQLNQSVGRPKIMFYFRVTPFYSTNVSELAQFQKVVRFQQKLTKADVFFWKYDQPLQFERLVREHLIHQLLELTSAPQVTPRKKKVASGRPKRPRKPETPQQEQKRPRVFFSAAREDADRVIPIYRALEDADLRPWLDLQDLVPGDRWQEAIKRAITDADVFLAFLSSASVSKTGYFQRELRLALEELDTRPAGRVYIIPVRLDPVDPPGKLANLQWIDVTSAEGVERLIDVIKRARGYVSNPTAT